MCVLPLIHVRRPIYTNSMHTVTHWRATLHTNTAPGLALRACSVLESGRKTPGHCPYPPGPTKGCNAFLM